MGLVDYEIVGTIGRDSDGLLLAWREEPIAVRGLYALHVVEPNRATDREFPRRLVGEAAYGVRAEHVGLVRVHEVVVEDELAAVVTDYVDGHSLDEVLDRRMAAGDPIETEAAIELTAHLLDAVDHVHRLNPEAGHHHGRITQSKVMLTADGGVKLLGVGIAPDRAERRSRERLGPQADQYAIGLIFLDLVLGRRVSWDESLHPTKGRWPRTLEAALREISLRDPRLPALLRMLAPLPDDRYASCAAAALDLRRVRAGFPEGPALPGFAAGEVAALRGDECDTTQLEDEDLASEWSVQGDPEPWEVSEPLTHTVTVPFATAFTPRAANWPRPVDPALTFDLLAPRPDRSRRRRPEGDMDNTGYGSDPTVQLNLAVLDPRDKSAVAGAEIEIDLNLGGSSPTLEPQSRPFAHAAVGSFARAVPMGAGETTIVHPDPAEIARAVDRAAAVALSAQETIPLFHAAQETLPPTRSSRSGWTVKRSPGRGGPRQRGLRPSDSGLLRRWGAQQWFERSNVLKGLLIAGAVLVLLLTVEMFKRTWVDAPAAERAAEEVAGDVHPELAPAADPNRID